MLGVGNPQRKPLPTVSRLRRVLENRTRIRGLVKEKCISVLLNKEGGRGFQLPSGKLDFLTGLMTKISPLLPPWVVCEFCKEKSVLI